MWPQALACPTPWRAPRHRAAAGPIFLVTKDAIPAAAAAELRRLQPKRVVVLGGGAAVSASVQAALAGYTAGEVTRLSGPDRHTTGAAISRHAFGPGAPVAYIATGEDFPDALAAYAG